jgi:hypothetical protein
VTSTATVDQIATAQQLNPNLPGADLNGTVTPETPPTTRSQWTTTEWAVLLLAQLPNVPITLNNVLNIERWMASEEPAGAWLARDNPLNASVGSGTSDGTGAQPDVNTGITNTAGMIEQSNMSAILAALQQNASTSTFEAAVVASPWASSHYGNGADFSSTPLFAFATGTGGNPTGAVGQATSGVGSTLSDLGLGGLSSVVSDISSSAWWKRVGIFALGGTLVVVGLAGFLATSDQGQKVLSSAPAAAALA